ncbi:MAG: aspartate/glutamate racemase family protein [Tissierellales bacterium]
MKLAVVSPMSEALAEQWGYKPLLERVIKGAANRDTEIVMKWADRNRNEHIDSYLFTAFPMFLNNKVLLEKMYEAEQEGCDGAMVACASDPAIDEIRALLSIPVVASVESMALAACMAGPKFAIVTLPDRRLGEGEERLISKYGLRERFTKLYYLDGPLDDFFTAFNNPDIIRERVMHTCKKAIDEGAHSIILGSTGLSVCVRAAEIVKVPQHDAPIFDSAGTAVKMLEYRVGLLQNIGLPPTCRAGEYALYPKEDLALLFAENQFRTGNP